MTHLDRFLRSIEPLLPSVERDDIIKELAANIRAEFDDKEAELGRPLSDAEQDAILQQHGSPLALAGRYQTQERRLAFGRELIGPALFPLYLRVLKIVLGLTLAACIAVVAILKGPLEIIDAIPATLVHLLVQFGIVTLCFVTAERTLGQALSKSPPRPRTEWIPRGESIAEFIALTVIAGWLIAVWKSPIWIVDAQTPGIRFGPVWHQVFLPIILTTIAGMVQAGIIAIQPTWTRFHSISMIVLDVAGLAIIVYLLQAGDWLIVVDPDPTGESARKIALVNKYVFLVSLLITAVAIAGHLMFHAVRLVRLANPRITVGAS
jgi:hypothetical protein